MKTNLQIFDHKKKNVAPHIQQKPKHSTTEQQQQYWIDVTDDQKKCTQ